MRGTAKLAIVLVGTLPLLQACQMFGGSSEPPRRYASQSNPNCARLQPLVTAQDGSLSRDDMEAALKAKFKQADLDNSGELSMAEVGPINDALRLQNVGASPVMDWNGDGRVNFQEFAGGWRTMFDLCAHGGGAVVSKNDMERSPNVAPPLTGTAAAKPKPGSSTKPEGSSTGGHVPGH